MGVSKLVFMAKVNSYILKLGIHTIIFVVLTVLTQVGGIIYISILPLFNFIKSKKLKRYYSLPLKIVSFITAYTLISFLIVPPFAKLFGRTPLPIGSETLKPTNISTVICNRHYVKSTLKELLVVNSIEVSKKHSGTITYYLDANFPFFNGFPLLPHLSHNDGKKVDLAFYYHKKGSNVQKHGSPSPIGYGKSVKPKSTEINTATFCTKQGYWQYNIIDRLVSPFKRKGYYFDEKKTSYLIQLFTKNNEVEKIFIEPFLVKRLKLKSPKMKFHRCHAVTHADHIHLQIK